jgi:hypothetical protein
MATNSYSQLWAPMNFEDDAQMTNFASIVDQGDSDLLTTMEIEVPISASASLASFDFSLGDSSRNNFSMLSMISDCDYAPPKSPVPQNQHNATFDFSHQKITPDEKNEEIQLPGSMELQIQCQNALKKLAKSHQRSDATRAAIKRQRSFFRRASKATTKLTTSPAPPDTNNWSSHQNVPQHVSSSNGRP